MCSRRRISKVACPPPNSHMHDHAAARYCDITQGNRSDKDYWSHRIIGLKICPERRALKPLYRGRDADC
jgi:hypothetical protein